MKSKIDWNGMSEQIFEHGTRIKTTICEKPIPQPVLMENCTSSLEPFPYHNFGERGIEVPIFTPGDDNMIGAAAVEAQLYEAFLDGDIIQPDMGYIFEGSTLRDNYYIKNVYGDTEECMTITIEEDSTKTPPNGRSQKAHNLIQSMNKRKR